MTVRIRGVAAVALAGSVFWSSTAAAESAWHDVCVSVRAATRDESTILSATVALTLARMRLTMVDRAASSSASSCWAMVNVEPGDASGTRVVVRSDNGDLLLDRTLRDPSAEIQREQVADAVRGAVEARLLAEEDTRSHEPPKHEETVAPASSPPSVDERLRSPPALVPTKFALDVSVLVASGPVASTEGVVTRVGGAAAFASRHGLRPSIALRGVYAFPFSAGDDRVAPQVKLGSLRLLGAVQPTRWSWGAFEVGTGGGVDVLSVEPASKLLPASALRAATTHVDPVLTGMTTLRVSVAPNVELTLSAMLDVNLVTHRYVLEQSAAQESVLSLWVVRPMLVAGLSFTALGSPAFPRSSP